MNLSNKVSATISDADQNKLLKEIESIKAKLPFLLNLSADDRKVLRKMGPRSIEYVNYCMEGALSYPDLLPRNLDPEELQRDVLLYGQLNQLLVRIEALKEALDDTLMAVGSDAMMASDVVYNTLKRSKQGDANIKSLLERISERYTYSKKSAKNPVENNGDVQPLNENKA